MYLGPNEYTIWHESTPEWIDTVEMSPDPVEFRDWITSLEKVDGNGQVWRVVDYDPSLIDPVVMDQFSANVEEADGSDEVDRWRPMSWTNGTCLGSNVIVWDNDSRVAAPQLQTGREKRALFWRDTSGGVCSGTLVQGPQSGSGRRYMTTAAHCVTPFAGGPTLGVSFVCSRGNFYTGADCVQNPPGGFTVVPSSGWLAGNSSRKWDYAVITWETATGPVIYDRDILTGVPAVGMTISNQSNSAIEANAVAAYGHPSFTHPTVSPLTCTNTNVNPGVENAGQFASPAPTFGRRLYYEFRTDHDATTNYVRTYLDATGGASGGALLNCPGGCGSTGGGEELVGIMVSGWWVGSNYRTGGPKWTRFSPLVGVL